MKQTNTYQTLNLEGRMFTCPVGGKRTTFQLVNEVGVGEAYAGLIYEVTDFEGFKYSGALDSTGTGEVNNHFAGPIALIFKQAYAGGSKDYVFLMARDHYPLKITELQVRAESTRFVNKDGSRTQDNPFETVKDTDFIQVEVRHLVEHTSHLPPKVDAYFPPSEGIMKIMEAMRNPVKHGVRIFGSRHTVMQVRPLRALRPLLSTDAAFCALNLYQLALMATLSYCPFGQDPDEHPVNAPRVSFPMIPSMGNWFGDALATFKEIWRVDPTQTHAYYPLFEDVPYSQRLEVVPFDPELYPINQPTEELDQETPATLHFLDDRGQEVDTDTQAFITHNRELILLAVRGTFDLPADVLRDADAFQVPFMEGAGKVHRGFYEAARQVYRFAVKYLDKFYAGQKLLICGHSLGGAIALLVAEMLRRRSDSYDLLLYTYGAPRAGDSDFVEGAKSLVHYRTVNHNDPVPSVPSAWMKFRPTQTLRQAFADYDGIALFAMSSYVVGMVDPNAFPYTHHGTLQHFMPVSFSADELSHILWAPSCEVLTDQAVCTLAVAQENGLPQRADFWEQVMNGANHTLVGGYVPACWAALRRWQEALEAKRSIVTAYEYERIDQALKLTQQNLLEHEHYIRHELDPGIISHKKTGQALLREANRVKVTRERLLLLKGTVLSAADVYGLYARQPELLAEALERWRQHPESLKKEQLAMAPTSLSEAECTALVGGHVIGAPYTFDWDSMG